MDINLNHITKIEGHASLKLRIENNKVVFCELGSFEGARFFEGILEGRRWDEAHEITSRICGICSTAHTTCGLQAIEKAMGIQVSKKTELLRELVTIGERLRSHATHLYFFALPDFLGFESAIAMASKYKNEVLRAVKLMKVGNRIVEIVGGRNMHPFCSVPGGYTHVPSREQLAEMRQLLQESIPDVEETVKLFAELDYPDFHHKAKYVCIQPDSAFPLISGRIVSNDGLNVDPSDYEKHFDEYVNPYSTAKFSTYQGKTYMVGAMARTNNNWERISPRTKALVDKLKIIFPTDNPFMNNLAQALEMVHWTEKAIEICNMDFRFEGLPKFDVKGGRGIASGEAPRGILFHDYTLNNLGIITKVNIITPTVQNLRAMNEDIRGFVEQVLEKKSLAQEEIILKIESLIRAYDPCFSCSTHFLKVNWV
ncbi:Ni/Fe hydrogenase subunit alpha [Candidatus Woesearchaeota archaeon]|nr:Ni/Fe hydrogenase subunit alpha [Candidatus Woesearchaeota archaeon]